MLVFFYWGPSYFGKCFHYALSEDVEIFSFSLMTHTLNHDVCESLH